MKTIILLLSFGLNLLLGFALIATSFEKTPVTESGNASYKIAILAPVIHPSFQQVEKGFIETLSKDQSLNFEFVHYNALGNKTLMRSEIEEIERLGFDLVLTLGAQATQMTKEVYIKKNNPTPIVFATVADPLGLGIVTSEASSGNQVTGVKETTDYQQQLSLLKYLKGDLHRLLLVYDPSQCSGLLKDKEKIAGITEKMGIELVVLEVFKTNEISQKVIPFIGKVDAVMVLKDNTVVPGIDALVKLCNREKIPLMATDLDSVDKGAALGFGVYEYDYGVESAKKALLILQDNRLPATIPITPVDDYKLKINRKAISEQGLNIDPTILFLIESGVT